MLIRMFSCIQSQLINEYPERDNYDALKSYEDIDL
jgi:hypothetical protein